MMGTRVCPRCGAPLAPNQVTCGNCGLRFSQQSEQISSSPYKTEPDLYNAPTEELSSDPPPYSPPPDQTLLAAPYRPAPAYAPVPPTLPRPPRRSRASSIALIVGIVLLLLLLIGSVFAFVRPRFFSTAATPTVTAATTNVSATATARAQTQATAHANATATAKARAAATASARAAATATANARATASATAATGSYPFSTNMKLDDPLVNNSKGVNWKTSANCTFTGGAYHASEAQNNTYYTCPAFNTNFSNITYQVTMQINKGDFGGITFRGNEATSKYYTFVFNQNGSYQLLLYTSSSKARTLQQGSAASAGFKAGPSQQNDIAVVLRGSSIELYVNKQKLAAVTDNTLSSGQIGVVVYNVGHATDVSFTNAKVWAL